MAGECFCVCEAKRELANKFIAGVDMGYELDLDFVDVREGLKKFTIPRKIRQSEKAILAFDGKFCSIEAFNVVVNRIFIRGIFIFSNVAAYD